MSKLDDSTWMMDQSALIRVHGLVNMEESTYMRVHGRAYMGESTWVRIMDERT